MRIVTPIVCLTTVILLGACDQQHVASGVDPGLGLECFGRHSTTLPPGTQYEGIEKSTGNELTIRIMNGVDVVTLDCSLNPDGTLLNAEK